MSEAVKVETVPEQNAPRRRSPRPIAEIVLHVDPSTMTVIHDTERFVRALNRLVTEPEATRSFSLALLRIEAIANLKLDGRQVSTRQLFIDEAENSLKQNYEHDTPFAETIRNTKALQEALFLADDNITADTFIAIHRKLLADTTRESYGGVLRTSTDRIGGGRYRSLVTLPPPEEIPALLDDLAAFCNNSTLPPLAQAALAHAQFVNIHPFARGNGKVARMIIQLVLRHRGLAPRVAPPLSLALAVSPHDYSAGIVSVCPREDDSADHDDAALNAWFNYFCACCQRAVKNAAHFKQQLDDIYSQWHEKIVPRADSATNLLMMELPRMPIFSTQSAARAIDRSVKRVNAAIDELLEAGIITQISEGKRNRIFEAPLMVELYVKLDGFQ